MKNPTHFLFTLGGLLLFPYLLSAQPQNVRLGEIWKQNHDKGLYFEGNPPQTLLGIYAELVSLTFHIAKFEPHSEQQLSIRYYAAEAWQTLLYAQEIRQQSYYYMQSKEIQTTKGWQTFGPWPVKEGLSELGINPRNLGILVQVGQKTDRTFLPAGVYIEEIPSGISSYLAQIRIGTSMSSGKFTVSTKNGKVVFTQIMGKKRGGTPVLLNIPTTNLPEEGWYQVHMQYENQATRNTESYDFWFWHIQY